MVAAATTSLPERAEQGRNYDYRYAWIRDQCFAGQAAAAVGGRDLLDSAVALRRATGCSTTGRSCARRTPSTADPVPDERRLDLPGYPGAPDVGSATGCNKQFQLDAFGEALLLFAAADRADRLDADGWQGGRRSRSTRSSSGRHEPDAGIWELEPTTLGAFPPDLRGRAAVPSPAARPERPAELGGARRPLVADVVAATACTPTDAGSAPRDDPEVDAALLLPGAPRRRPRRRPAQPSRRWRAVVDELAEDGYVYRFRHDDRPLHEAEGAFLLCGFHLALASHQQGDVGGALRWFERNRGALRTAGPVHRGVRRRAAPAARQPAAGVRARAA